MSDRHHHERRSSKTRSRRDSTDKHHADGHTKSSAGSKGSRKHTSLDASKENQMPNGEAGNGKAGRHRRSHSRSKSLVAHGEAKDRSTKSAKKAVSINESGTISRRPIGTASKTYPKSPDPRGRGRSRAGQLAEETEETKRDDDEDDRNRATKKTKKKKKKKVAAAGKENDPAGAKKETGITGEIRSKTTQKISSGGQVSPPWDEQQEASAEYRRQQLASHPDDDSDDDDGSDPPWSESEGPAGKPYTDQVLFDREMDRMAAIVDDKLFVDVDDDDDDDYDDSDFDDECSDEEEADEGDPVVQQVNGRQTEAARKVDVRRPRQLGTRQTGAARLVTKTTVEQDETVERRPTKKPVTQRRAVSEFEQLDLKGGTIKGVGKNDFNPEAQAEALRKAFKGLGTDEKAIINVLTSHTNAQRQMIKKKYKTMYGKDLISDFEDELGGHFLDSVLAMMCPAHFYDAHSMRKAMVGIGTNESCLIEILCTRSNSELELLREAYFAEFRRNLEGDILSETSGDFSSLLVSMLNAERDETEEVDWDLAVKDAQKLIAAGVAKLGTDEQVFNHILCLRSQQQLRATIEEYKRHSKRDLENDLRKEFSGDMRDGLLAIVKIAKNPPAFFAELLHDSLKGMGTNDETLIRILVSRSEMDLEDIKEEFQKRYKKTLAKTVKDDTSGDYSRLLLKVINPKG